ncbi:MAG: hypothetical protein FWF90_18325 [Promicromonosporaceae bacterium]|nr:hypothetical protein [Promicromonosporaceae bacterium]
MSEFQVARRTKAEPSAAVFGRVVGSFILFLGGFVLLGTGASDEGSTSWLWFVLGLLAVALAFGLPMRGASRK